jgi:EpsI family protein
MISWNARFATVAILLAGTALLLQARAGHEFVSPRTALASFPLEFKNWTGADVPIPNEVLVTLRAGEFLQRTYQEQNGGGSYVDFYVAYLHNQNALFGHLPMDCLEATGWSRLESGTTTLAFPGDVPFPANRVLIAKGDERQLVLFWYTARGRRVASEDTINAYLTFDSLFLNRSDNALIRMNTPVQGGETAREAERRLLSFAGLAGPRLKDYIPL